MQILNQTHEIERFHNYLREKIRDELPDDNDEPLLPKQYKRFLLRQMK